MATTRRSARLTTPRTFRSDAPRRRLSDGRSAVAARPRIGLRARAAVSFAATGCAVAVVFAVVTYSLARDYLVSQREQAAARQAYANARLTRAALRSPQPDVVGLLSGIAGEPDSNSLVRHGGRWYSTSVEVGADSVPRDLVRVVSARGDAGSQRYRSSDGSLILATGVPLPGVEALYFQLVPLQELEGTLDVLSRLVAVGALIATLGAGIVGAAAARRLVKPLAPIGVAAGRIARGELGTRLELAADADLQPLVDAFNDMASALEARVAREARFSADVTHELRSPLAAVAAATQVIDRRRDLLPREVQNAFDVVTEKIQTLQQTVLDLLEISRIDADSAAVTFERVELRPFLNRLMDLHETDGTLLCVADDAPQTFSADRRRLAQALGNVLANASAYGGGAVAVYVETEGPELRFLIDDRGPGVDPSERDAIFGRFARGDAGVRSGSASGTGLGLALAAEQVALHGGRIWAEDAPGGGARFVIALPVERP